MSKSVLRGWLHGHKSGAAPVGVGRRVVGMVVLVALAGGYLGYLYLTRDERVRRQAEQFLQEFTGGEVAIHSASFRLFSGIEVAGVEVRVPASQQFFAGLASPDERTIFAARRVHLVHTPWSLLKGRLKVEQIEADSPVLTMVRRVSGERYSYNWQHLLARQRTTDQQEWQALPLVRIANAEVRTITVGDDPAKRPEPILLDAMARPRQADGYVIEIRIRQPTPGSARASIDLATGTFSLESMPLGVQEIAPALPPKYEQWCHNLELTGQAREIRRRHLPPDRDEYEVVVSDVNLSVPLDESELHGEQAVAGRLIRLSQVAGSLTFTEQRLGFDLRGRLNEAPCHVKGSVTDYRGPFSAIGLDIDVKCDGLVLPRLATADARERISQLGHRIVSFFHDFDPAGSVLTDLHVFRQAGENTPTRVTGMIEALGCSASFRGFPYRCRDVRGVVRFLDEKDGGGIVVEDLTARHGPASIHIEGRLEEPRWFTKAELNIRGYSVPLDRELFAALKPSYRKIWARFAPFGLVNVIASLRRDAGSQDKGPAPWQTDVDIELTDVTGWFETFPYRLDHTTGLIRIRQGAIILERLAGMRGRASVGISGQARLGGLEQHLHVRLAAANVAVDGSLLAALPTSARRVLDKYGVRGRADVLGRVWQVAGDAELEYDLHASLRDGTVRHDQFAYPLERVHGRLRVRPGRIDLAHLDGYCDDAAVRISGVLDLAPGASGTELSIEASNLMLDTRLRGALPSAMQTAWDQLQPAGEVNAAVTLRHGPDGAEWQAMIEPLGSSFCYEKFPLPLTNARGKIFAGPDDVRFQDFVARYGQATVALDGEVGWTAQPQGQLAIDADDLPLDETLLRALPQSFQRVLRTIQATGRFDLNLTDLRYESDQAGRRQWAYSGTLTLDDCSMHVGLPLSELTGTVAASGQTGTRGEGFSVDGQLRLKRASISQRIVNDLTGHLVKPPDSDRLTITDASGQLYGGSVAGLVQADFGGDGTRYGVSMVIRDAQMGPLLRPGDAPSVRSAFGGSVTGNLFLSGRAGSSVDRRGGGEVRLHRAQVRRLPLIESLLDAANIAKPPTETLDDAFARFFLQGRTLSFEQIDLRGRGLLLYGTGSMLLPEQYLDLTVVAATLEGMQRVPVLSELLEGAVRELVEVKIGGTVSQPRFEVSPLRSLGAALRTLFGSSAGQRDGVGR
ncbi:MAG TPA: hypothetical protein VMZ31_19890 [Phycisphaerae bacterium]|nr:hypothetical protein [Phycisphaerae bacterium]